MTGSRIMMHVHCWEVTSQHGLDMWEIFVWDWETGDLVTMARIRVVVHCSFHPLRCSASHPRAGESRLDGIPRSPSSMDFG